MVAVIIIVAVTVTKHKRLRKQTNKFAKLIAK